MNKSELYRFESKNLEKWINKWIGWRGKLGWLYLFLSRISSDITLYSKDSSGNRIFLQQQFKTKLLNFQEFFPKMCDSLAEDHFFIMTLILYLVIEAIIDQNLFIKADIVCTYRKKLHLAFKSISFSMWLKISLRRNENVSNFLTFKNKTCSMKTTKRQQINKWMEFARKIIETKRLTYCYLFITLFLTLTRCTYCFSV